jgi:hypothetical protein
MRLDRLPQEPIHADDPAAIVSGQRHIKPREDAAPTLGRDPDNVVGLKTMAVHKHPVDRDKKAAGSAVFIRQMVDRSLEPAARVRVRRVMVMLVTGIVVRHGSL